MEIHKKAFASFAYNLSLVSSIEFVDDISVRLHHPNICDRNSHQQHYYHAVYIK